MAVRRLRVELENDTDLTGVKRLKSQPSFSSVVREAVKAKSLQSLCNMLEPVLRKVVHEEFQHGLVQHVGSLQRPSQLSIEEVEPPSNLQLVFMSSMSPQIYTKGKIQDNDNKLLQVKLIDTRTGETPVISPGSPIKVEMVVLHGDFPSWDTVNWTADEFNSNMVNKRDGKPPLLIGERTVVLCEGVASFGELEFTDNSRWERTGRFRLAVRVYPGSYGGTRIKEAITDPFKVLDRRGELYKKHDTPSLHDEVWRLKRIAKDGAFHKRLEKANIKTVQEFLRLLTDDSNLLRKILGKNTSERMWKEATNHAMKCRVGVEPHCHQGIVIGNTTCTFEEPTPRQMANEEDLKEMKKANGVSCGGIFATQQINSMIQDGVVSWPRSYQQDIVMSTYPEGVVGIGDSLNNVQLDNSILIENSEFGVCDPFQHV